MEFREFVYFFSKYDFRKPQNNVRYFLKVLKFTLIHLSDLKYKC